MSIAEQKMELVRLIMEADEETTGKMIELAKQVHQTVQKFTDNELAMFHATRNRYLSDTSNTFLMEDAHAYIRSLKKK